MKLAYKLLALILSVSAFTLILSNCAATDDSTARLSPLEMALSDAISFSDTDLGLATAISIDSNTDPRQTPRHPHHYWSHQCLL